MQHCPDVHPLGNAGRAIWLEDRYLLGRLHDLAQRPLPVSGPPPARGPGPCPEAERIGASLAGLASATGT